MVETIEAEIGEPSIWVGGFDDRAFQQGRTFEMVDVNDQI